MAKSPKSHLLEKLRAQAESVSAKRVEQQQLSREVVERVDRRLHAIFQYFDEACKLLQIIAPAIERDFTVPQIVRYTSMTFDRGVVMFRKQRVQQHDVFAHVVIYYTLTGPPPPPVRVAMRRSLAGSGSVVTSSPDSRAASINSRAISRSASICRSR